MESNNDFDRLILSYFLSFRAKNGIKNAKFNFVASRVTNLLCLTYIEDFVLSSG